MNISVIIPTYNRADLVCEAVQSVLRQKAPADEIWIIDDGSTDDTLEKLSTFAGRINIHQQPRQGVSAARNTGIRLSKNDWLAFLDSDDLWKPKKLWRQIEELAKNLNARLCYTDEEWRKNDQWKNPKKIHSKYSGWIYEKCLPLCIISPSSVMVHRSVFAEVGLFDENLPACEDYDLWLRVCSRFSALFIPEKLIVKRAGNWEQLSRQHSMDKYRIQALVKRLQSRELTEEQSAATEKMLQEKIHIYAQGCKKHERHEELAWLESIKTVVL